MSDVTVTRHFSPLERKNLPFCDWISIYQDHPEQCKTLNNGCIVNIDIDGSVENTIIKKLEIEGSDETKIFIKSDGHRVTFTGNVSRLVIPPKIHRFWK